MGLREQKKSLGAPDMERLRSIRRIFGQDTPLPDPEYKWLSARYKRARLEWNPHVKNQVTFLRYTSSVTVNFWSEELPRESLKATVLYSDRHSWLADQIKRISFSCHFVYVADPFRQFRKVLHRPKPNKWRSISTPATSYNHFNGQLLIVI